ncbi:PREDICTED: UDP-N-acetylglucosamine transferase subunit ALG14 homolog [Priapulus caudatus]|uniref:UDP-N-acetylglucosamine transferase subunit ALG14 n=1 Tax=Priapulus caudatus TaxID=37621 RepID=A0ABM1E8A0_PRICU|nr:PREDICTED: UDP-N-acetylglucosamine transferase subunit ALG14 homolog [Priapulus caudatus]
MSGEIGEAGGEAEPGETEKVAGGGGHTTEILRIVSSLGRQYTPKVYISADTDHISQDKIKELENSITQKDRYEIVTIPRSREVNQSWMSTVLSTFYACVYAIPVLLTHRPDVVLCNGPGTCIPICGAAFLLKVLYVKRTRIIFVESICRVKTLSLSGKMLYYFADELLVQWPSLLDLYGRCRYIGRLV